MGTAEVDRLKKQITIVSHIITYGSANSSEFTSQIRDEIETMWNEPQASIFLNNEWVLIQFKITAKANSSVTELEILQNTSPQNNYFRIEAFVNGRISFVDGVGCNTGYFLTDNLYKGSTTAAHEYGHTIGLDHPTNLDLRGKGVPGIMYPRGTWVDPTYQYNPALPPGTEGGGHMHPMYRKVKAEDIQHLNLHKLRFQNNLAIVGAFSSVYHLNHAEPPAEENTTSFSA